MVDAAVVTNVVEATAKAAEEHAINKRGGNGGDTFGGNGIEPVMQAALAAASADAKLVLEVQHAADAAAGRTNANAERVAVAIINACVALGAARPVGSTYTAIARVAMIK